MLNGAVVNYISLFSFENQNICHTGSVRVHIAVILKQQKNRRAGETQDTPKNLIPSGSVDHGL